MWSCVWLASLLLLLGGSWSEAVPAEALKGFDAFQKIEAEASNLSYSMHPSDECSGEGVPYYMYNYDNPDGSCMRYYDVDFGSGAQLVSVRLWGYKDYSSTGRIEFHLDGQYNPVFATVSVGPAGSINCNFITVTSFLTLIVSGLHDVYLTFSSFEHSYVGGVDWFFFNHTIDKA